MPREKSPELSFVETPTHALMRRTSKENGDEHRAKRCRRAQTTRHQRLVRSAEEPHCKPDRLDHPCWSYRPGDLHAVVSVKFHPVVSCSQREGGVDDQGHRHRQAYEVPTRSQRKNDPYLHGLRLEVDLGSHGVRPESPTWGKLRT